MRFEVLGPVRVTGLHEARPVAGARQRVLLAALLVHAGRPVPAERLAELVWDGAPPRRAVPTLRTYVARLRLALGPEAAARIVTADGGYLADVGPGELDVLAFDELCGQAGGAVRAADWAWAARHAGRALGLWRGAPLGDVPCQGLRDAWLPRLDQQRLQVTEWHVEAGLRLGRHEQLVPQLRQLTADNPLRERFHAQLIRALAQCGWQGEALAAYRQARTVLVAELGIEPGPELRRLHEEILTGHGDPHAPRQQPPAAWAGAGARALASGPALAAAPVTAVPRQLPAAASHFTGRRAELALITTPTGTAQPPAAPGGTVACAISGMAGTGKTTLAVHAAHQLTDRYPDGQLFIDLHGYTPGQPPRTPAHALGTLLHALGVPAGQVPAQADERAALYRQRLAGTRTLIVADNALNEAQVRPLLPAAPGCLVLITSRRRLKGLHDANPITLDVLTEPDAVALLAAITAPGHPTAAGPDLAEITRLCGQLPLAVRIAGTLLGHRPAWTPSYLASQLHDPRHRLTILTDGDHDLSAALDLSYHRLGQPQQQLYRALAQAPGPGIDPPAAAALLGTTLATATTLLEDLLDHNLLTQHAHGSYQLHNLIHAHTRTLNHHTPRPRRGTPDHQHHHHNTRTTRNAPALVARHPRPAPHTPEPSPPP